MLGQRNEEGGMADQVIETDAPVVATSGAEEKDRPPRSRPRYLAAAIGVVLLVGLAVAVAVTRGGSGGQASPTPSSVATTVPTTLTVNQVASIIAARKDDILTADRSMGACAILYPDCQPGQLVDVLTFATDAEILQTKIQTEIDAGKAAPDEVSQLLSDTRSHADAVNQSFTAFSNAGCVVPQPGECETLMTRFWLARGRLVEDMKAWGPYLG